MRQHYTCEKCGHLVAWGTEESTRESLVDSFGAEAFEDLLTWEGWPPIGGHEQCRICNTTRFTVGRVAFDGILSVSNGEIK